MTFPSLRLALVAGLVLPLGLGAGAMAQDAPPPAPGAAAHHWPTPAERQAHMAEHLRAVLQLQPGQEGALAAWLEAMKPPADFRAHMQAERQADRSLTTPERLDRRLAHFDEMRARFAARAAATKQFYAQLSPSQQKAFDALAPMMMRHHFGDHHGMWHGHGGFGPHGGDRHPTGPGGPPAS